MRRAGWAGLIGLGALILAALPAHAFTAGLGRLAPATTAAVWVTSAANADADDEEDNNDEEAAEKPQQEPTKDAAPAKPAAPLPATEPSSQPAPPAADPLTAIGLRSFPGARVTSLHVTRRPAATQAAETQPSDNAPITTLDVTLAAPADFLAVRRHFERQLSDAVVIEKHDDRLSSVLIRTPFPRHPTDRPKTVQVLVEKWASDPALASRRRARLEQLRWNQIEVRKKHLLAHLAEADRARLVKALAPLEERLEDLLVDVGRWQGRPVRPADLRPEESQPLQAAYQAIFARFSTVLPDSQRWRAEEREILQLQAALADEVFVRVHATLPGP